MSSSADELDCCKEDCNTVPDADSAGATAMPDADSAGCCEEDCNTVPDADSAGAAAVPDADIKIKQQ